MKNASILLAVLGGAAAGAVLGVLFAPEKGEYTRRQIQDFLREKGICPKEDKLNELVDEIAAELSNK